MDWTRQVGLWASLDPGVRTHEPGRLPALDEVRDAVAREWANAKRKEIEDRRFDELLKRYEVTIENFGGAAANP